MGRRSKRPRVDAPESAIVLSTALERMIAFEMNEAEQNAAFVAIKKVMRDLIDLYDRRHNYDIDCHYFKMKSGIVVAECEGVTLYIKDGEMARFEIVDIWMPTLCKWKGCEFPLPGMGFVATACFMGRRMCDPFVPGDDLLGEIEAQPGDMPKPVWIFVTKWP